MLFGKSPGAARLGVAPEEAARRLRNNINKQGHLGVEHRYASQLSFLKTCYARVISQL